MLKESYYGNLGISPSSDLGVGMSAVVSHSYP